MSSFSTTKIAGLLLLALLPHLASAAQEGDVWGMASPQALALEIGTILNYKGNNKALKKNGKRIPKWRLTGKGKLTLNVQAFDDAKNNQTVLSTRMSSKWKKAPEEEQPFLLRTANAEALNDAKAMKESFQAGSNFTYEADDGETFLVKIERYKLGMTAETNMTAQVKFLGIKPTNKTRTMDMTMSMIKQKLTVTSETAKSRPRQSQGTPGNVIVKQLNPNIVIDGFVTFDGKKATVRSYSTTGRVTIDFKKELDNTDPKTMATKFDLNPADISIHTAMGVPDTAVTVITKSEFDATDRRRLGWKPSHDIPCRREGFHHSFVNRVIRESERQS